MSKRESVLWILLCIIVNFQQVSSDYLDGQNVISRSKYAKIFKIKYEHYSSHSENITVTCKNNCKNLNNDLSFQYIFFINGSSDTELHDLPQPTPLPPLRVSTKKSSLPGNSRPNEALRSNHPQDVDETVNLPRIDANTGLIEKPKIMGLPLSNIIYQNDSSTDTSETLFLYRVNQTLNLTCSVKENRILKWIFDEHDRGMTRQEYKIKKTSRMFVLKAEDNGKSIICSSMSRFGPFETSKAVINLRQILDDDNTEAGSNWIIGCAAAVMAAGLVAGCMVVICRRSKNITSSQSGCENLTFENDITAPEMPEQMNTCPPIYDYAYSKTKDSSVSPNDAQTFAQNRDSISTVSHYYIEIDEYFINQRKAAKERKLFK